MIALTLLMLVCSAAGQIDPDDIPLIDELDPLSYIGQYKQLYASPIVLETFEKNGTCVTATYGLVNATALSVYNHMLLFAPDGEVSDINGVAITTDDPAKLNVYLDNGSPNAADYWIMELGPKRDYGELIDMYSWALVTDYRGLSLFVLVRDVEEFEAEFEEYVLARLDEIGFNQVLNRPVKVYHGDDCAYPDV